MPTNRELEIIMRLRDEVSKRLKGIEGAFIRFKNSVKELGVHMKQLGREIFQVGHFISFLGASITGPLLLAFRNSADYSLRVSTQMERLKNVTTAFQVTIGEALAPIMECFTNILGALLNHWNSLGSAQQQAIIQTTFMTGVYLTMSGVLVTIIGKVMAFTGEVLKLGAAFMSLSGAQMAIVAIIAAIASLIVFWDKLGRVATPVLNAIEIGTKMIAIGFMNVVHGINQALSTVLDKASMIYEKVSQFKLLPESMKINYKIAALSLKDMSNQLRANAAVTDNYIKNLEGGIQKILVSGKGDLVSFFDNAHKKIKSIFDLFKNPPKVDIQPVVKQFNALKDIAQNTAQAMTQSMSDLFFNVITGKINNLKQVFADFGNSILRILSNALAKFFLMKTIGMAFPGLGQFFHQGGLVFHSGGIIPRAHSGMLASDEVPIIAQTGEGVLSRRGMASLGVDNFNRLNRGEKVGGSSVSIIINPVIQAWDSRDVYRNRQMITGIISEAIKSNTQLRKIIKDYA
ncbi:MAG: hypothetical protein KC713_02075 [Candidatus Omnitrophica bacterium]|nr:hypothetical protein [Candidatus Omnitrophota bacterium]